MVNLLSFGALLCLGASVVNAAPADDLASGYQKPSPVQFPKRQLFGGAADPLPTVKLPYGTWRANKYDKEKDVRGHCAPLRGASMVVTSFPCRC